jgi:hypothetical protein
MPFHGTKLNAKNTAAAIASIRPVHRRSMPTVAPKTIRILSTSWASSR